MIHEAKYKHSTSTHCYYCDREYGKHRSKVQKTPNGLIIKTKDHIIPIAKGGINNVRNYIGCCSDCNHLKGSRTTWEFAEFIESINYKHMMHQYLPLIKKRAWKLYNKTSKAHQNINN